jgi:peptide chain release factor 1
VGVEPADKNDIMLEVSAGVGGQEAMLFTGEMWDMYQAYAHYKGWTFELVDFEKSEIGW